MFAIDFKLVLMSKSRALHPLYNVSMTELSNCLRSQQWMNGHL